MLLVKNTEVPWTLLGSKLEEFLQELNEALQNENKGRRASLIEITCYQYSSEKYEPETEYHFTWGEFGKQFPLDQDILEDDGADDEAEPSDPIIQLLKDMQARLDQALAETGENYLLRPGLRVIFTSANPGDSCPEGYRCEYNPRKDGWFLRRYFTGMNHECRCRWTSAGC